MKCCILQRCICYEIDLILKSIGDAHGLLLLLLTRKHPGIKRIKRC